MLSTHKKHQLILGTMVAILGFSLYANTIGHSFVLDDYVVIKENSIVKQGLTGIPSLLKTDYQYGYGYKSNKFYRPLSLIMFAIEWQISPNNPTLHHFIHVLLYAFTGFILFYTLSDLLRGYNLILPFVVSLLFISHPIHTEVVANIKSRDLMMAFFFVILTFHLLQKYLQSDNFIFLIISLICYFLSLCFKESTITILAIIPMLIYTFTDTELCKNCLIAMLFVIPIGIYLILRDMILEMGNIDISTVSIVGVLAVVPVLMSIFLIRMHRSVLITFSLLLIMAVGYLLLQIKTSMPDYFDRIPVSIEIMGTYLLKLFYPHPLVFDASYNQHPYISWNNLKAVIPLLAYFGLSILAILSIKRKSIIAFGIFYFIVSMSIHVYSVFYLDLPYGERFLYISSLGFTLVIGFLLVSILKTDLQYVDFAKLSEIFKSNIIILSITLVIIGLYSFKTITRNIDWQTNTTLRTADVYKSPNSARMRYYYGLTLMEDRAVNATTEDERKNYLYQAINEFLTATAINENMREPYSQLGIAYFRLGDYHKSLEYYKKARVNADVANNMGILYYKTGDYEKALSLFQIAAQLNPNLANTYFNMGIIQSSLGNYQQAIEHLKSSIKRDAYHAPTYYHLGLIYQKNRDEKNARIQFSKAYQLDPRLLK